MKNGLDMAPLSADTISGYGLDQISPNNWQIITPRGDFQYKTGSRALMLQHIEWLRLQATGTPATLGAMPNAMNLNFYGFTIADNASFPLQYSSAKIASLPAYFQLPELNAALDVVRQGARWFQDGNGITFDVMSLAQQRPELAMVLTEWQKQKDNNKNMLTLGVALAGIGGLYWMASRLKWI